MHYVREIAKMIGEMQGGDELANQAYEAATLAKADLLTDMVGEFPELQGIMGRYYAQHEGLSDDVAFAIEDHYKPRFAGDTLPRNPVGVCVALADKLETLVNMFGIGEIPTGDKDPFALRRHALGVIRILNEKNLPLNLITLINRTIEILEKDESSRLEVSNSNESIEKQHQIKQESREQLRTFIRERLAGNLREQGYTAQEVDAVLSLNTLQLQLILNDILKRLVAVRAFSELPEATSLAAANKRVDNILKKTIKENQFLSLDTSLFQEPEEQKLHEALLHISNLMNNSLEDYVNCLRVQAELKSPIDNFFDHVMVNVEDEKLRYNRLALLKSLHSTMNYVADISKLAT